MGILGHFTPSKAIVGGVILSETVMDLGCFSVSRRGLSGGSACRARRDAVERMGGFGGVRCSRLCCLGARMRKPSSHWGRFVMSYRGDVRSLMPRLFLSRKVRYSRVVGASLALVAWASAISRRGVSNLLWLLR